MSARDIAWLAGAVLAAAGIGTLAAFAVAWGAWRPRRKRTTIEVPGGIVTWTKPMTEHQAAEFKRQWAEANAAGRWHRLTVFGDEGLTMSESHLWEVDHPYYGSDVNPNPCESFAELREAVERLQEGPNHVYRWDWTDWSQPQHDDVFVDGEDRSEQQFAVFLVLARKSMTINFTCPVTHGEEPEVLAWLRSDRVSGALRRMWEPILDTEGAAA